MFHVELDFSVKIAGCPSAGLEAIDFRRAAGIPEAPDNFFRITWSGQDESICRRFAAWLNADGDLIAQHDDTVCARHSPTGSSYAARRLISPKWGERNSPFGAREVPAELIADLCDTHPEGESSVKSAVVATLDYLDRTAKAEVAAAKAEVAAEEAVLDAAKAALAAITPEQLIDEDGDFAGIPRLREILGKDHVDAMGNSYLTVSRVVKDAKAIAEANKLRERNDWIEKHGSNRLRRAIAEGIDCNAVYRDERLALERPGWVWVGDTPGDYGTPRNSTDEDFALLDEARKTDRSAKLVYWTIDHECDEDCYSDEDCPRYDWDGPAAVATFLGREIVFGVPEKLLA